MATMCHKMAADRKTKTMKLRCEVELLRELDKIAKRDFTTRSAVVRSACVDFVKEKKKAA